MTGFYVAETFEKRHSDVLRDIEKLECSDEFRERNLRCPRIMQKYLENNTKMFLKQLVQRNFPL